MTWRCDHEAQGDHLAESWWVNHRHLQEMPGQAGTQENVAQGPPWRGLLPGVLWVASGQMSSVRQEGGVTMSEYTVPDTGECAHCGAQLKPDPAELSWPALEFCDCECAARYFKGRLGGKNFFNSEDYEIFSRALDELAAAWRRELHRERKSGITHHIDGVARCPSCGSAKVMEGRQT